MSQRFAAGQQRWRARLGTLRQVVRQEVLARQLAAQVPDVPARRVLDVGCGQGTQLLRLARRGHRVVGLDSSAVLLADLDRALAAETAQVRDRASRIHGDIADLARLFAPGCFDVVLCHGVLMYVDDPEPLIADLARLVAPGGVVSLLVRNGDALAMRPGLQGDWPAAHRAFDDMAYGNRIGVAARADRREVLAALLARQGLGLRAWYGVRVFTDAAPADAPVPDEPAWSQLLDCEERAGATDPYRAVAALTHLVAGREPPCA